MLYLYLSFKPHTSLHLFFILYPSRIHRQRFILPPTTLISTLHLLTVVESIPANHKQSYLHIYMTFLVYLPLIYLSLHYCALPTYPLSLYLPPYLSLHTLLTSYHLSSHTSIHPPPATLHIPIISS